MDEMVKDLLQQPFGLFLHRQQIGGLAKVTVESDFLAYLGAVGFVPGIGHFSMVIFDTINGSSAKGVTVV